MSPPSDIQVFIESARSQGATDEIIVGRNGLTVPAYKRSGSAKDAFLYLLSFATLATWTIGLGSVVFTLVDYWIKDPLSPNNEYGNFFYQMADSLACVIIAFPVYLFTMRYITRELGAHPEKLESAVRKWLTYIALLIAAGIVVGDSIVFLTYFLRGELTARFAAKVVTTLAIAGGVFWYYMGSLGKRTTARKSANE
jgi:Domain of unknown function (DUF5671)